MITFTREVNQGIVIGDDVISVYVIEIRDDKVRLGIQAPPHIPVVRTRNPSCEEEQFLRRCGEVKSEIHELASQLQVIIGRLQALEREMNDITSIGRRVTEPRPDGW